jgi:hypothetical protein
MPMTQTEFAEKLAASGDADLFGGVTKYQHVERLGSENVEGLLDGFPLVVQEKIDGCSLSVWLEAGELCIASRNRLLAGPGIAEGDVDDFRGAVKYVRAHAGISEVLDAHPDWVLRGEWLVKNVVVYSPEAWNHFYVFDVQRKDGNYVGVMDYMESLDAAGVRMVPILGIIEREDGDGWIVNEARCYGWYNWLLEHQAVPDSHDITPSNGGLVALLARDAAVPSMLGAPLAEGLVIKRYGFVNKFGRTQWGKVVNADFAEAHKAEQCTEKDPAEIRFVARCVTGDLIRKTIGKIESRKGSRFETKDIAELLGRVWYDAFQEELWEFVKKERVGAFDFKTANRLAVRKARDFALAYCGGSN